MGQKLLAAAVDENAFPSDWMFGASNKYDDLTHVNIDCRKYACGKIIIIECSYMNNLELQYRSNLCGTHLHVCQRFALSSLNKQ